MRDIFDSDFDEVLERRRGRELRKSRWWQNKINNNPVCYYCSCVLDAKSATMDHIVPISRGGKSTKGNVVTACKECNQAKQSLTAVEWDDYIEGKRQK